jgi:hypothetical protein
MYVCRLQINWEIKKKIRPQIRIEVTRSMQPAEISSVAILLIMWLAQAEVQFELASMSNERTKLYQMISQLDDRYAAELVDIITSPLQ